jgi:thiosulfate/3-mercaptopyruvate sulfurtransferase
MMNKGSFKNSVPHPELLVSTEWLEAHLSDPAVFIFDCTSLSIRKDGASYRNEATNAVFAAGHIPGAQYIDVQKDLSDNTHRCRFMLPRAEEFAASMERFGVHPSARVVLYSTEDPWWATRVWWLLRFFGFDYAAVLDGGFGKWKREGRRVETGLGTSRPKGAFFPRERKELFADRDKVLAAIGDNRICTISARAPAHFVGREGNDYGRPGRIAGSRNVPASSLIEANTGAYLPPEELRERFAPLSLGGKRVIAYCGQGVAASAVVFVLTMLGHPDVQLYDASLSEWAAADDLPMEVG